MTRGLAVLAVYAVFFLSGISGLVYQVVWVRVFGNVFGNNVYSAAAVTAVFMCGLGVGSYVIGRLADLRFRGDPRLPLRGYALCELGIALLALGLSLVLPRLEAFSAAASAYEAGPGGWYQLSAGSYVLRYALAVVLLTPITFLMGGTLTLLIRALVARDVSVAGWRIGVLYGLNTLGAAAGAFATDFALIPALGVFRTELVAIALNAVAGAGAWWLARRHWEGEAAIASADAPAPTLDAAARRRLLGTGAALFLSGLAALGMEILWFRHLLTVIGAYRAVFSLLLTVILLGICFGALLGGWLHRRFGRPVTFYVVGQTGFVLLALAELAWFDMDSVSASLAGLEDAWRGAGGVQQLALQAWFNLRPIFDVVAMPALLMGLTFPLANAHVQQLESDVGRRAGALYLTNTLGNVAGSLLVGFVLLPRLGVQGSVAVIAFSGALALVPLHWSRGEEAPLPGLRVGAAVPALVLLVCALVAWSALPEFSLLKKPRLSMGQTRGAEVKALSVSEGIHESIVVVEVTGIERRLYTNGHSMSSTHLMSQRYMRLFSHLPLLQMESPRRVTVICFGVGNTLHAASLHPSVERLEAVDLSRNVIRHARFFRETNGDVIRDPRTRVFINDGRQHLRMQEPESIDLVTLEPPPIHFAGVSSLYSREFYELARSRLVPGGYMTQWLPAYQISGDATLALIRAFLDVFPQTVLLSGFERELILMGVKGDAIEVDPARLRAKLAAQPAIRADLERIEAGTLTELLGTFAAGPETLARATADAPAVTEDRPLMEYSIRAHLHETRIPAEIFDVGTFDAWCPACSEAGRPAPGLETLPAYLGTLSACYRGEAFRSFSIFDPFGKRRSSGTLPPVPGQGAALRESRYLQRVFRPPCAFERPGAAG